MLKNLFLLGLLTWVSFSYAQEKDYPVAHDSMADAESFKVERGSPEQEAKRELAGGKINKKTSGSEESYQQEANSDDSEVRYWQYSE